ncbi:MAG: response regulator [Anaerolineaceae bacterium]|nr:response regulator [Anaerolineaceae bacterium]
MRESVELTLRRNDHDVVTADDGRAALAALGRGRFDLVVTDLKMPRMGGVELLEKIKSRWPDTAVVLITAFGTVDVAVRAMKLGAFDFLGKPFKADQLLAVVDRALEHRRLRKENEALKTQVRGQGEVALVGCSRAIGRIREQITRVAGSRATVLICGQSGVGKEVVARQIHLQSPRAERPMLCMNCAALSEGLLESELFGHERGAFTGADRLRKGRFELADGGTLMLDEISEVEPRLQSKLLRVLQEQQFERVGSSETLQVDVRVLATTNRNLAEAVTAGEFREDLYYRLNVVPIRIPPLRERREDVAVLAEHFLSQYSRREGRQAVSFSADCLDLLGCYDWPGNVRELEHLVERACVMGLGPTIRADDLRSWLSGVPRVGGPQFAPGTPLETVEREMIHATLEKFGGHRARTAEALGISVRTLGMKVKAYQMAEVGRRLKEANRKNLPVAAQ